MRGYSTMVMGMFYCISSPGKAITTAHNISKDASSSSLSTTITSLLTPTCQRFMNSRKYQSDCMKHPSVIYPLLVTGLGGCGTHAVTQQLREHGMDVGHEEIEIHGSVSWFYAVNDVLARTHYPHHAKLSSQTYLSPRFAQVCHLVRCPMEQISSFTTHLNASYDFVRKHMLQQIKPPPRIQQDRGRKRSHADKSNRRLGRNEEHSNISYVEKENSVWMSRNHVRFFRDRKSLIENSGKDCPRGARCWLHFSALSWLFWNSHIQRYADATFRVEKDLPELMKKAENVIQRKTADTQIHHHRSVETTNPSSPWLSWFSYTSWVLFFRSLMTRMGIRPKQVRKSSVKHKMHLEYGLEDIVQLDALLAQEIVILAEVLGYSIKNNNNNNNNNTWICL